MSQAEPTPPRRPAEKQVTPRLEPLPETAPPADPRQGDLAHEQAQRLMRAIDAILQDTAQNRSDARKLPSKNEFLVPPLWTETREDREAKVKNLLDATLGIVTDVPFISAVCHIIYNNNIVKYTFRHCLKVLFTLCYHLYS